MGREGPILAGRFGLFLIASLLAAGWPGLAARAAQPEPFPVATDIRLGGDDGQTRFVVDLTRKIDLHAFTLADPYRVVIDLPQITFAVPPKTGESGRGLVSAFRYGLVMKGGSRIVLDLKKPVKIEQAFVLDSAAGQPARLVLDLAATDRAMFLRAIAQENRAPRPDPRKSEPRASLAPGARDPRPLIVIDPGHGGLDTGTKSPGGDIEEKAIVLEFGVLLRDELERSGKFRVAMTRTDDTFVALGDRVAFARQRDAALLISLHADWLSKREGDAQGATVYTLSENASDAEAARLADAENRADVIAGIDLSNEPSDVADILLDLAQRETKTFSHQFARGLVAELQRSIRLHRHPLRSAGFKVLRAPDVPSVLVELGYVSNKQDLKALMSDAWRTKAARTIAQAVDKFFARRLAGAP